MPNPQGSTRRLLVIHDEEDRRAALLQSARELGWEVASFSTCERALTAHHRSLTPHVILIGHTPPSRIESDGETHFEVLHHSRRQWPGSQMVLELQATAPLSFCVQAISRGVASFLERRSATVDRQDLRRALEQAMQKHERDSMLRAPMGMREIFEYCGLVGASPTMARLLIRATQAAPISDAPVLINGESGTGKQCIAELIHRLDPKRSAHPFLSINCAAISDGLADSSLFGHVRGAFTGASRDRAGYFRAADGGVLLLDEIGELDLSVQPKLLRVLQEGLVLPVGDDRECAVDVRVVAATHRNLEALVQQGKFRFDLFHRLSVITLDVPPLRQRPEDIPALVDYFVHKHADHYAGTIRDVDDRVYEALSRMGLKGNVRELESLIRRSMIFKTSGNRLELTDLPQPILSELVGSPSDYGVPRELIDHVCRRIDKGALKLSDVIEECERAILSQMLKSPSVSVAELASRLGVSRRTLYNKRSRLGV